MEIWEQVSIGHRNWGEFHKLFAAKFISWLVFWFMLKVVFVIGSAIDRLCDGDIGFTLATALVAATTTALASIIFFMLIMASIIVAICSFMASMSVFIDFCTSSTSPNTLALARVRQGHRKRKMQGSCMSKHENKRYPICRKKRAQCPMCAVKKAIWTFRLLVTTDETNIQSMCDDMMQMRKSAIGGCTQHGNILK
ncbi:hypothetical protein HKD37_09G025040 [Glycine soja]